jgi:hypothetical protein
MVQGMEEKEQPTIKICADESTAVTLKSFELLLKIYDPKKMSIIYEIKSDLPCEKTPLYDQVSKDIYVTLKKYNLDDNDVFTVLFNYLAATCIANNFKKNTAVEIFKLILDREMPAIIELVREDKDNG